MIKIFKRNNSERGAITLETALSALVFILILLIVLDLAQFGHKMLTARFLAAKVMREVVVANCSKRNTPDFNTFIKDQAGFFGLSNYNADNVSICPTTIRCCNIAEGSSCPNPIKDFGARRSFMRVMVNVPVKMIMTQFLGVDMVNIQTQTMGRNEQYNPC